MKKGKLALGGIGIFLAGALCGALAMPVLGFHLSPFFLFSHDPQSFIMGKLTGKLDLTAEQQEKVAPLVAQMLEGLRAVRNPCMDAEEKVIQDSQDRINGVLNPEQIEKHREMEERFKKHRQEMRNP